MIPVSTPVVSGNEIKYLQECIETNWISSEGPFVKKLEEQFAERVGKKHGIAVCNGSAALEVAVAALGIGPGDEVILPTFTIISCAAAIVRAGAVPVLVDCEAKTWNMNVQQIESKITSKTKAIMVVHIYGLPVDMDPVLELGQKYGLKIIEDAAEGHGLEYKSKPCGSFGDISTFSFYPNKLITTGEGGMVLTDSDYLSDRCRSLRNLCFQTDKRFIHEELGWNFRMSNVQAALGVAQLERLDESVSQKRKIGKQYTELLSGIPNVQLPKPKTSYAENIYWVYGIVMGSRITFDAKHAMEQLTQRGIGTRPFFWPIHEQPGLKKMGLFKGEQHPVSEKIARRGFYVPSGLNLSDDQLEYVARVVKEVVL
ncbi:MAG: DegT/DnrJ/EryC1/StrS family aminotransferase [Deltaproteobacteria bacterium]|nr:DegT/DnrJ/EryC1/StrS family aminotransferase [Deltaproteobacteria bacterium]